MDFKWGHHVFYERNKQIALEVIAIICFPIIMAMREIVF